MRRLVHRAATCCVALSAVAVTVLTTPSAASDPADPARELLKATGAESCPIAAESARDTQGLFVGFGGSSTREAELGFQSDRTWEVRLSQGEEAGFKGGLDIEGLDEIGAADVYAMLGSTFAVTLATPDGDEAKQFVGYWNNPSTADDATKALLRKRVDSVYVAHDVSVGGALDLFGQTAASADVKGELGEEHFTSGFTDSIFALNVKASRLAIIYPPPVPTDLDLGLSLEQLFDPTGRLVGITLRVTYSDVGDATVSASLTPGRAATAGSGRVERTVGAVSLKLGSDAAGELGEVVGTLDLTNPAVGAQAAADVAGVAAGLTDPVGLVRALTDLVHLLDQHGIVTHRVYHVVRAGTGIAAGVEFGVDIELDFSGDRTSTTLLTADSVNVDGSTGPWKPCTDALTVDLHPIKDTVPGLGATMQAWMAHHTPDPSSPDFVIDNPCAAGTAATCAGLFPVNYDRQPPYPDLFEVVDPVQGADCPLPFAKEAEDAAKASCRVGEMLIRLPHPVPVAQAMDLLKTQLPADATGPAPEATRYSGTVACATWHSATLAGLAGLDDPSGTVRVALMSGTLNLGSFFDALIGNAPPAPPYDPKDIRTIALIVSGRLSLC